MIGTGDGDERLQLALQTGKIGVWDWDLIQDRISWSESLHLIHGVDRAATPSLALFLELVHPDDRERVAAAIRATLDGHSPHELELRAIRPNGETIWLFINAMVIRHDGHPVRMLGATIDVTDRKRTEMRLRESEERFAKAFNASPLSLTISSLLSGRLIEVNETFTVVSGYSREEALGRTTAELGLWAKLSDREQELGLIRASGRVRNAEYCFRNRHGQEIVGLLSAECIEIAGEPCALTVIQDITDRKQIERALQQADRRKDEFLATLAHELRNPLAPIRNGVEVLKRAGSDPQTMQQVVAMMDRQVTQMVRLVDDLLDVSRISRGKIELRRECIDIAAAVRSAIESNRPLLDKYGSELIVTLPPRSLWVDGDLVRLAQVLANLLNNATKYTPAGGTIRLTVAGEGAEAVVRVCDNGIGIAAEMLPRIFELFTQADDSIERSQSGLGIGLTIVQRLVEMHGGSITAHSDGPGRGSEFVVRLPLAAQVTTPPIPDHALA